MQKVGVRAFAYVSGNGLLSGLVAELQSRASRWQFRHSEEGRLQAFRNVDMFKSYKSTASYPVSE